MKLNRLFVMLLVLASIFSLSLMIACGDDDDDDDDATDDDATDDDATDDDDDDGWPGDQTIQVVTADGEATASLAGLTIYEYTDPETGDVYDAVSIQEVVAQVVTDATTVDGYVANFVASDGYDIYRQRLDGDYRPLPTWDNLALGWFILCGEDCDEADDIKAVWDESLNFESFMGARYMKGGTMEFVELVLFDEAATVTVQYGDVPAKGAVDLQGLPAFVDGDGDLAIYLHHVVNEAALEDFEPKDLTYVFDFIGNDDYSLLAHIMEYGDTVLDLPYWKDYDEGKDIHHGWIKNGDVDGYKVVWDEATGFGGSYSCKHMDDGTIEVIDVTDLVK